MNISAISMVSNTNSIQKNQSPLAFNGEANVNKVLKDATAKVVKKEKTFWEKFKKFMIPEDTRTYEELEQQQEDALDDIIRLS